MKKIWHYLQHHVREDFNAGYYSVVAAFLIISVALNYTFDFEDSHLDAMTGYSKFFAYLLFYGIPYFITVYAYSFFYKRKDIFSSPDFWKKSVFGITLMALDGSMPFLQNAISALFHPHMQYWAYKVGVNAISFFIVLIPILIFYHVYDRTEKHIYGLNARKFDTTPYFAMLLIMLPLLVAASFDETFLRQYPMYKPSRAHLYMDVPEWFTIGAYEFAYGLDFITVEYLFRGFLVIGMASVLGRGAVVPMVVIYCFLHFGKPAGEAISSIAGGYVLGVIAYETKSVWGGIIVHMGIAWMMEGIAFVQKM
jgi:hypothetical protein